MRVWRRLTVSAALDGAAAVAARVRRGGGGPSARRPAASTASPSSSRSASRDGFDPTGEYYTYSFAIESNLMIRTLVGYDHVAGPAGNMLVPDLATTVPQPTDGGTTYTFHLKPGVKFGPPVSRAVTSKDVLYAIERIANAQGRRRVRLLLLADRRLRRLRARARRRRSPGIRTPNASTIVFHLTRPTGDFLYRLAMPATGPIPAEVAEVLRGPGRASTGRTSSRPAPT